MLEFIDANLIYLLINLEKLNCIYLKDETCYSNN